MTLSKLAKLATKLDSKGLTKEADIIDELIKKLAEDSTESLEVNSEEDSEVQQ